MSLFGRSEARREKEQQIQQQSQLGTVDATATGNGSARAAERSTADSRVSGTTAQALARHEQQRRDEQWRDEQEARRRVEKRAPYEAEKPHDQKVEDAVVTRERSAAGDMPVMHGDNRGLAPLFSPEMAQNFRIRWNATQIGFVDDPHLAVRQADELVAMMMKSLAQTFAEERAQLETHTNDSASTENLRVALQRYRSFFQRLLTL